MGTTTDENVGAALRAAIGCFSWGLGIAAGDSGSHIRSHLTAEESWELVNTSEKTGVPCMMLENVCYFRDMLLLLNLQSRTAASPFTADSVHLPRR